MNYMCISLNEFNEKQSAIHNWRLQNVDGYRATSWANPEISKHHSDEKYLLTLPDNYESILGNLETIDHIPNEWFMQITY